MADGITFRMVTKPFTEMVVERERGMPGAAAWALREAGRATAQTAKRVAPILQDPSAISADANKNAYKAELRQGQSRLDQPVRGLLRQSISASRYLRRSGASTYSLKVGPRGPHVRLYAAKIEARAHYMFAGGLAGQAALTRAARDAFERVWKGRHG